MKKKQVSNKPDRNKSSAPVREEESVKEGATVSVREKMAGADERTIIQEQERLKREARKKKAKRRRRIALAVILVLLLSGGGYVAWSRNHIVQQETASVKIEKAAGQEIVFAQISEINGNEITYRIAEAAANDEMPGRDNTDGQGSAAEVPSEQRGERPRGFEGGEMPDMSGFGGGERPDMSGFRGSRGDAQSQRGQTAADTGMFVYDGTTYRVGTERITTYIPVGTEVTTKLGTVTTFSRLAAEDCVALVIEEDGGEEMIAAVYIVG